MSTAKQLSDTFNQKNHAPTRLIAGGEYKTNADTPVTIGGRIKEYHPTDSPFVWSIQGNWYNEHTGQFIMFAQPQGSPSLRHYHLTRSDRRSIALPIITREERMERRCTHEEWWQQFVTEGTICYVRCTIGFSRIVASTDEHLNDIPLGLWYRLIIAQAHDRMDVKAWKEAHGIPRENPRFPWSLSDTVCIAKCAAQMIQERCR